MITAAFRLLEEQDESYKQWIVETHEKIKVGLAELERGEGVDGEVVMVELRDMVRQARENQA